MNYISSLWRLRQSSPLTDALRSGPATALARLLACLTAVIMCSFVSRTALADVPVASNVNIFGTAEVGQTLFGSYSYFDIDGDLEGVSTFRWLRDGVTPVGTGSTYLIQAADIGSTLVFEVTPVAQTPPGELIGNPATSPPTNPVVPANTAPVANNVAISGNAVVGQILTGSYTYSDADNDPEGSSSRQWLRNGTTLVGTGLFYLIQGADIGTTLTFRVIPAATSGVSPGTATDSPPTDPVLPANSVPVASNVSITGNAEAGQVLTGSYTYSDVDSDLEGNSIRLWLRNGVTQVGTGLNYLIQTADIGSTLTFRVIPVAQTGASPGLAADSAPTGQVAPANSPPVASNVAISGVVQVGSTLSGTYTYSDVDGDLEGQSTFRWLRGGSAIPGEVGNTYVLAIADVGEEVRFEVTPVAQTGALVGAPVQSAPVIVNNVPPVITAQAPLSTAEDTPITIALGDLTVTDPDNTYPDDFTLSVGAGSNYSVVNNVVTPDTDFSGDLVVPVTVNDGVADSPVFNLDVVVTAENDRPVITGQQQLLIPEDTPVSITLADLVVFDPDNVFPDDFTLTVGDGDNYTRTGVTITPAQDFDQTLMVPVTVNDGEINSPVFMLEVDIDPINDPPSLLLPIGGQQAVEASVFDLDISANFADPDNADLSFVATGLPVSGNISLDPATGVFRGTPAESDAEDFPYNVMVTVSDGVLSATDTFALTVSALDRANVALTVSAAPTPAMLNDQVQFSFAIQNNGPMGASGIALTGDFVGSGLAVTPVGTTTCIVDPPVGQTTAFSCTIGDLLLGATADIAISASSASAGAITLAATAAGVNPVPIDPNIADNSAQEAVGVAEAFSNGAVQVLGTNQVLSMAHGDLNGDGATDIAVGTIAGTNALVYLSDGFRGFTAVPIAIPDVNAQNGVAIADFDGDNIADVVLANAGTPDTVYRNVGNGSSFALLATLPGATISNDVDVGDFNLDNAMDIVLAVTGGNLVYLGDNTGAFALNGAPLGSEDSRDVAVGLIDNNGRADIVFANVGSPSRLWTGNPAGVFTPQQTYDIGDASSVVVAELIGSVNDSALDIGFGRISSGVGDIPGNPILENDGAGSLTVNSVLGASPTNDILAGDVNRDGLNDLVFINATGVHQIWNRDGQGFTLHSEQIVDVTDNTGLLADLGFTDVGEPGGIDLAMGGSPDPGAGIYLNDGLGNLGKGDITPPELTLNGEDPMIVPSGTPYQDPSATANDNIDGDISTSVVASDTVNTAVVGTYVVTYDVVDAAGNAATPISRTVEVTPATGTGGGGGGPLTPFSLLFLTIATLFSARNSHRITASRAPKLNLRGTRQ